MWDSIGTYEKIACFESRSLSEGQFPAMCRGKYSAFQRYGFGPAVMADCAGRGQK